MSSLGWCPEFSPTREEFSSFSRYIRTVVEPQCGKIGMCKIIPPRGWFSRSYELVDLPNGVVSKPVSQHVAGKKGIYNVDLVERKTMDASEFFDLTVAANADQPEENMHPDDVERLFWKSLRPTMDAPVYGADIVASLFGDDPAMSWNVNHLDTILKCIDLPGVTRAMLYFGMWRSMFAFHTEDMDLYSINYLHTGKPKFWYAVPPSAASQLERAAQAMFPEKYHTCNQFLRHKTSLISPSRLKEFGIPYAKAFQRPGEFVITFPATYHQGFNLGFNIAEAVNFASLRWIPYGLKAKVCKCVHDSVRIDMDQFMIKLMEAGGSNNDILGEDAWVFSCKCGKFTSSDEPSFIVEEQWFECSSCNIWAHVRCVHPEMSILKEEELPSSILCHRCIAFDHIENHSPPVHNSSKKTGPECLTPRPPKRKRKLTTKESSPKAVKTKHNFVKGSIIQFEDSEARVTVVDGKYMRLHYKGQSLDQDEWVPVDLKEMQKEIIAVKPPVRRGSQ